MKKVYSAVADLTAKQFFMRVALVFAGVFGLVGMMSTGTQMMAHHAVQASAVLMSCFATSVTVSGIYALLTMSHGRVMALA